MNRIALIQSEFLLLPYFVIFLSHDRRACICRIASNGRCYRFTNRPEPYSVQTSVISCCLSIMTIDTMLQPTEHTVLQTTDQTVYLLVLCFGLLIAAASLFMPSRWMIGQHQKISIEKFGIALDVSVRTVFFLCGLGLAGYMLSVFRENDTESLAAKKASIEKALEEENIEIQSYQFAHAELDKFINRQGRYKLEFANADQNFLSKNKKFFKDVDIQVNILKTDSTQENLSNDDLRSLKKDIHLISNSFGLILEVTRLNPDYSLEILASYSKDGTELNWRTELQLIGSPLHLDLD